MKTVVRTKVTACLIAGCIFLAAVADVSLQIWSDYQETLARQETTVHDIARVVEAQVHSSLQQADAMLDLLAETIREDNGLARMREASRQKRLASYCAALTGCQSLAVINPDGKVVALSNASHFKPIDVSDREYFYVTKDTKKLFVGPAVVSRIPGNPILFSIARPVLDSSGKLLAVVSAGMTTAHLTDFYGLMGFSVAPTVSVYKRNGDLVARHPDMARYVGQNFIKSPLFAEQLPKRESGLYRSTSVIDGKKRIVAFKSLPEFGLVVFAGIELDTAFHYWKIRAWRMSVASAASVIIIFLALYWGYRMIKRGSRLKQKNIELDRLSNLDALTEIPNRRYFDTVLVREWQQHLVEGKPLSLLMIDVDEFKKFNDCYGHQSGDECLRSVAAALQDAMMRSADTVARYGGEEFGVILNADEEGAVAVGERLLAAVRALAIPHERSSAEHIVTISVGVASAPSGNFSTADELVAAADAALYDAKYSSRNRVAQYRHSALTA